MRKILEEPSEKKARNSDATIEIITGENTRNSLSSTAGSGIDTLFCNTDLEQYLQVAFYKVCQVRKSLGRMPAASWTAKHLKINLAEAEKVHGKVQSFIDCLKPLNTIEHKPEEQAASEISPEKLLKITRRAYQKLQIDLKTGNR